MREGRRTDRNPWRVAAIAGMASYLDSAALVASGLAIGTFYADELHLDAATVGGLLGTQTFAVAIGAITGGRIGDRFGRRRTFLATLIVFSAGVAALALAPGAALLWIGVVLAGLAIGADVPVSLAMINESAPAGSKGRMVAFTELLWGLGIVVVAALTAALASLGPVAARIVFLHLLVVAVVVLLLRTTIPESPEWRRARQAAPTTSVVRRLLDRPVLSAVLATGLYYAAWGVGANTLGQFGAYIWTHRSGGDVASWSIVSLVGLPLGIGAGLLFLKVVDTSKRRPWFLVGSVMLVLAWLAPTLLGPTPVALVTASLLLTASTGFSGETIYKVWSQELLPTLLRGTAQGITFAVNRVAAACFGVVTPLLVVASPTVLFGVLLALAVVAGGIGMLWIPRIARVEAADGTLAMPATDPEGVHS